MRASWSSRRCCRCFMVCLTCFRGGSDRPSGRFKGGATSDELASFGLEDGGGVEDEDEDEEEVEDPLLWLTSLLLLLLLLDLLDRVRAATGPLRRRVEVAKRHAEQRRSDMVDIALLYNGCRSSVLARALLYVSEVLSHRCRPGE